MANSSHKDSVVFFDITDEDTKKVINDTTPSNTVRKTYSDINLFKKFLKKEGESRDFDKIPVVQLDKLIARFVLSIRYKDGEENIRNYEPDSLTSKFNSIARHLKDEFTIDIKNPKNLDFEHSRKTLASARTKAKEMGLGQKPRKSEPFTPEELSEFTKQGVIGERKLKYTKVS